MSGDGRVVFDFENEDEAIGEPPPLEATARDADAVSKASSISSSAASAAAKPPRRKKPPRPTLADTSDLNEEFLSALADTRKIKKRHEEGRRYDDDDDEDPEQAEKELRRIRRRRQEALDSVEEVGDVMRIGDEEGEGDDDPPPPPRSRRKSRSKAPPPSSSEDEDDEPPPPPRRPPRRSKADVWLEERQQKAMRVARIEQLSTKGIPCALPDNADWMSLELDTLEKELAVMEIKSRRRAKILKMRAGLFGTNKGVEWALTSHPGPDFLKFPRVKGLEKAVTDEIDEFDDALERLYDLWFGESGQAHPLVEVLILEAIIVGNHVSRNPDGSGGFKTKVDGQNTTSSGNASATNLMANLSNLVSQNPAMAGPVAQAMAGLQAPQQDPPQQQAPPHPLQRQPQQPPPPRPRFDFGNFGVPPVFAAQSSSGSQEHNDDFIAQSRAMGRDFKAAEQSEDALLRRIVDDAVDHASVSKKQSRISELSSSSGSDEEEEQAPLTVEVRSRGKR